MTTRKEAPQGKKKGPPKVSEMTEAERAVWKERSDRERREREQLNQAFGERITQACARNPEFAEGGRGMQAKIAKRMGVTEEAVRRWRVGNSRPRPPMMHKLAEILGVDESWLATGTSPVQTTAERRSQRKIAAGAIDVVAGLVEMNGGKVAFPRPDDPRRDYVHFYAMLDGDMVAYHVTLGQSTGNDKYSFHLPSERTDCVVLGVVLARPLRPHLIRLPERLIEKHGVHQGGYVEVEVLDDDGQYLSGTDVWPRVVSFSPADMERGQAA